MRQSYQSASPPITPWSDPPARCRLHLAAAIDIALWRALAYARSVARHSPLAGKALRWGVLLLWWTATFQLHIHARYWLRARRLRRARPAVPAIAPPEAIDPDSLRLPSANEPLVSVIVPTYGQVDYTLRCLAAIAAHDPGVALEVLVIDDAWDGPEVADLARVQGIRLVRNESNLGFLRSCNMAARLAKGRFLYFLNNDTRVLENWLAPMLALFEQRGDVGAVGAKLLYPDGRLQEAGGIIWRDGSGWNFGRHEDPTAPVYNYVREVDYCSGAALLVKREDFLRLDGFDARYTPAYFEDSDLAFRLRRIGLKTLYQPAAQVVHFEGVSHGVDTAVGIKSHQVVNRRCFVDTWAGTLAAQHYPNGQNLLRARDRAMHRGVVLVIDHFVPTPDRDAGSRTMMAFLHVLLRAGLVVKFWPHNLSYSEGYTETLQAMGVEVFYGPRQAPFETWIRENGDAIDTVLVSRPDVAEDVLPLLRRHARARVVYYGHDLHFWRMRQQAAALGDPVRGDAALARAADAMQAREFAIWAQADLSLYPSEEEALIASALQPAAPIASVVPYCFDSFHADRTAPAGADILFVGGFGHPPNADAAVWFATEILPIIQKARPDAHLSVIGSAPGARVRALAGPHVSVQADVSDAVLAAAYGQARVAVVPLRCGAGVKLKVVEALRAGLPLVTTPVGAQGLPGLSQVASVVDDAADFAAAVVALLNDDAAWAQRSAAQARFAQARFSRDRMEASLLTAVGVGRG